MPTITARVRCCGQNHTVRYTPGGPLAFLDHDSADVALATEQLVSEPCGCARLLRAIRAKAFTADCPKNEISKAAIAECGKRAAQRNRPAADPMATPLKARFAARVAALAQAALDQCTYRKPRSSWAGGEDTWTASVSNTTTHCKRETWKEWSSNGKWSGTSGRLQISVLIGWYSRVYKRGIAVVDGCFVLECDPDTGELIAAKQGAGLAVEARRALTKKGNLKWL